MKVEDKTTFKYNEQEVEEMTREEYMEMCGDLSEEECVQFFGCTKTALKDGTAVWNMSLEFAYNEFITGQCQC